MLSGGFLQHLALKRSQNIYNMRCNNTHLPCVFNIEPHRPARFPKRSENKATGGEAVLVNSE